MEYVRQEVNNLGALNAELEKIEVALSDKLGTESTGPRTMHADLDMNSNQILNLSTPVSPTDPVRLQDIPDLVTAAQGANYVGETAPLTAFQGMRWYNPTLPTTFVYYIDGDSGQWVEEVHAGIEEPGMEYTGDTAPTNLRIGMRWFNPSIPTTFILMYDGDSMQWVEAGAAPIDGSLRSDLKTYPFEFAPFTAATLPSAASHAGRFVTLSDRGFKLAYSDGSSWLYAADNNLVV